MKGSASAARLLDRIQAGQAVCGVVGIGYVGLPLAVALGAAGYRVLAFDVDEDVVASLREGRSHIADVPAEEVAALVSADRLEPTADMARLAECDAICICVPTPLSKTRDPDVSYVVSAAESVAAALRPGQLVVLESTSYPGTTRELLLPRLEAGGLRVGHDFLLCFSPERTDPANPEWDVRTTPKVVGGVTAACLEAGLALYGRALERLVPVASPESAELSKLLENTFRAVNIGLVNEMAQVADRLGVDIWEVIEAAATKPFGFMAFMPGPGIGGHCIPLDPHYLAWKMKTLDYRTRMVELAGEINAEMPHYVAGKVQDALNDERKAVNGSRILLLGVAYKRDVDDVRESPALDVMRLLEAKGATVGYHDPCVPELSAAEAGTPRRSVDLAEDALRDADCVVITTDHTAVDYARVLRLARLVVDTRNATRGLRGTGGARVVGLSG